MLLKIFAFGPRQYVQDGWNRFDGFVVCLSILGLILKTIGEAGINPSAVRVFRVFRTARALRLVKGARGIRMLLRTFLLSLPSLWNIGCLLFLVFFVFAILGVYLFGEAPFGENLDSNTNFMNFGRAVQVEHIRLTLG